MQNKNPTNKLKNNINTQQIVGVIDNSSPANTLQEDRKIESTPQVNESPNISQKQDIVKHSEPKVVTVYKDRPKRPGCLGCGIGCNTIGCMFSFILLFCCASIIFIIINRPAFIWDRVVSFLNQGLELPQYTPSSASYVEENIISNLKTGQNDVYITEDQLTTIARDRFPQFKDLTFDIESEELKFYWALDNNTNPIYANVSMKIVDNNIKISKIGTPNLDLPEFTSSAINSAIISLLNINGQSGEDSILNTILNSDSNFKVNKIEFQKDKVYLDVFLNINLFN